VGARDESEKRYGRNRKEKKKKKEKVARKTE